jgi:hypothetical protein
MRAPAAPLTRVRDDISFSNIFFGISVLAAKYFGSAAMNEFVLLVWSKAQFAHTVIRCADAVFFPHTSGALGA